MRYDAVLFDNGGTLTHRTSPVAAVCSLAARLGVDISEEDAARYWRRSKEHSRTLMAEKRQRRNLSRTDHRDAYVHGYSPFDEIAPGLADLMYDEWKTNPQTMVPYPDTPAVLKSFAGAGIPIGDRQQHGLVASTRATRPTGMDALHPDLRAVVRSGHRQAGSGAVPDRVRAARRRRRTGR